MCTSWTIKCFDISYVFGRLYITPLYWCTLSQYITNFSVTFFPNIWVGRRNKSHDVWCWVCKLKTALPASFEFVANKCQNNTELNHTPNHKKLWSHCIIEINLRFLWWGLLFIKHKLLLLYTQKIMSYWVFFFESCLFLVSVIMSRTYISIHSALCLVANWRSIMMVVVEIKRQNCQLHCLGFQNGEVPNEQNFLSLAIL